MCTYPYFEWADLLVSTLLLPSLSSEVFVLFEIDPDLNAEVHLFECEVIIRGPYGAICFSK